MTNVRQAENAGRRVVADYPHDHNPYLAHVPGAACFAVCEEGHRRMGGPRPPVQSATTMAAVRFNERYSRACCDLDLPR